MRKQHLFFSCAYICFHLYGCTHVWVHTEPWGWIWGLPQSLPTISTEESCLAAPRALTTHKARLGGQPGQASPSGYSAGTRFFKLVGQNSDCQAISIDTRRSVMSHNKKFKGNGLLGSSVSPGLSQYLCPFCFKVTSLSSSISFNGFKMTVLVQTTHPPAAVVFVCFHFIQIYLPEALKQVSSVAPVPEPQSRLTLESATGSQAATITSPRGPKCLNLQICADTSLFWNKN